MIDKSQVLSFVQRAGPVLPRDVVREFGGDTLLVGAVLSQLVDAKQIKLSHTKVGGSPVYYTTGQESKLQDLYKFLKDMEKKAFDRLKYQGVIRDSTADPAIRVALRNIKDFAKPLEVNLQDRREIFWKWYLLDNAEAEKLIVPQIKVAKKESVEKKPQQTIEKEEPEQKITESNELLERVKTYFSNKKIEILEEEVIRKNSDIEMIVYIPSPVGKLKYFCKIRDKKKSNDKDLSSAYVQGEMKKLPVLYVTTGDLTNKAKDMLNTQFKTVSVLYI